MAEDCIDMEIGGTLQQRISSCLIELDPLLSSETEPVVASMVVAEKRIGSDGKGNLIECVCNIMGIRDIKTVSSTASLSEVGMDSLVSSEPFPTNIFGEKKTTFFVIDRYGLI